MDKYEKLYNEALERARNLYPGVHEHNKKMLEQIFPELAESEDERIIKALEAFINQPEIADKITFEARIEWLAWLEEQKDKNCLACDQHLKGYIAGRKVTEEEKQKESLHISESCKEKANSFTNEDERIRRTLVEYFGPKVQLDFVRGVPIQKIRDWLEKQKEQNGEDEECTDFTIYHPLKNGKGEYECIPYSFYGSLTSFSEDKDLIDFLRTCFYTEEDCNEWIEQQKEQKPLETPSPSVIYTEQGEVLAEQKPAEWHPEDERNLNVCLSYIKDESLRSWLIDAIHVRYDKSTWSEDIILKAVKEVGLTQHQIDWLKTNVFPPKQEWSEEEEQMFGNILNHYSLIEAPTDGNGISKERYLAFIKALRPDTFQNGNSRPKTSDNWKPSEEQMNALQNAVALTACDKELARLYNQLKKL